MARRPARPLAGKHQANPTAKSAQPITTGRAYCCGRGKTPGPFSRHVCFPIPIFPVLRKNENKRKDRGIHHHQGPSPAIRLPVGQLYTMAATQNMQNSFAPEVVASEYMSHSAPQAREPHNPLYPVDDHKGPAPNPPPAQGTVEKEKKRKILGLSVPVFWVVVVVAVLLVLGTGIGVGVGVSQSKSSASPPPTSPTAPDTADSEPADPEESATSSDSPSSTRSAPVTSGTVGLADNSCTSTAPRTYTADDGTHFTQFCFTDWPNGGAAADGRGDVEDLDRLTLYTFEDCMEACIEFNEDLDGDSGTECAAVSYNSNLTSIIAVGKQGGNCFLKNKRGEDHTGTAESACAAIAR